MKVRTFLKKEHQPKTNKFHLNQITMKIRNLLLIVFFYCLAFSAMGQSDGIIQGVIRVKLSPKLLPYKGIETKKTKSNIVTTGIAALDKVNAAYSANDMHRVFRYSPKFEDKHRAYGLHLWYEIQVSSKASISDILSAYSKIDGVELAEPLYKISLVGEGNYTKVSPNEINSKSSTTSTTYNDPLLPDQWHYNNTGQYGGTAGWDINLFNAWVLTSGISNVVVAIMDQGVDYSHEDLNSNMWINTPEKNGITGKDDDNNGYIDDIYGFNFITNYGQVDKGSHGTHVAGTIAAVNNNGKGVCGIAGGSGNGDGARVMSCEIIGNTGGSTEESYIFAADNGAIISQNSWGYSGTGTGNAAVYTAIDYFIAEAGKFSNSPMQGGIVIFASGNDNTTEKHWPGAYEKCISVNALGARGEKASYSNYGDWTDISAPGGSSNVNSKQGVLSLAPNNGYAYMDGTSMACPHVSGVAALVISQLGGGGFSNEGLKAHLLTSFKDIYSNPLNAHYSNLLGSGLIDAVSAMQKDNSLPPAPIVDLKLDGIAQEIADISWTVPQDQNGAKPHSFQILYSMDSTFVGTVPVYSSNKSEIGQKITYSITDLLATSKYYFTVRSVDRFGNVSGNSNLINGTTNAGPTTVVNPTSLSLPIKVNGTKTGTASFTVSNTGVGLLKYNVSKYHFSNTDKASFGDVTYPSVLNINESSILSVGGQEIEPIETIIPDAQTSYSPALEKIYYNRSKGGWYLGDVDTSFANSVAISYYVDETAGFNLTNVAAYLRLDKSKGPIAIEIRTGDQLTTSKLVQAQNYTTSYTDYAEHYYDIKLNNQMLLPKGTTFWIVIHIPHGHLYPFYAGYQTATGYAERCYMSTNVGKSWSRLVDVYWDTKLVWGVSAISKLAPLSEFVTLANATGTVTSNTETVTITADATNLINGTYNENLLVYTNETAKPIITVPFTITVDNQQPVIVVPELIEFGSVLMGSEKSIDLVIPNNGLGKYKSATITISDPQFKSSVTSGITISALSNSTVTFRFKPTVLGTSNAIVTLKGSNQDIPTANTNIIYTFALNGVGAEPPVISIAPASKTFDPVTVGNVLNSSVTVSNTGKYPLKYYVPIFASSNLGTDNKYTHKYGYTFIPDTANAQTLYSWTDISASGVKITSLFTSNSAYVYHRIPLNFTFPFFGSKNDSIYITKHGVLSFDNKGAFNTSPISHLVAGMPNKYISPLGMLNDYNLVTSGNVYYQQFPGYIIIQYDNVSSTSAAGNVTFQAKLFENGDIRFYYKTVPARAKTSFWNSCLIGLGDLTLNDGLAIHTYATTSPYTVLKVKNEPANGSTIALTCPGPGIISTIDKPSGVLYAGQNTVVNYTINTATLPEGLINQKLNIVSNDPNNPVATHAILVNITGGGSPSAVLSTTVLNFGDVQQSAVKSMRVYIKNAGTKNFTVTSYTLDNANYTITESSTDLKCGRNLPVTLLMSTSALGSCNSVLTIVTDIAGTFTVNLSGNVIEKSSISTDVTSITQTLVSGTTYSSQINIQNTGAGTLEFTPSGAQWLKLSKPTLPVKESSSDYSLTSTYNSLNAPVYDWIELIKDGKEISDSITTFVGYGSYFTVPLPWTFSFYGNNYDTAYITISGVVKFNKEDDFPFMGPQQTIPNAAKPNNFISALWAMSYVHPTLPNAGLYFKCFEDKLVIENVGYMDGFGMGSPMTWETILYKDGSIKFQYQNYSSKLVTMGLAGIENQDGSKGIQFSSRQIGYINARTVVSIVPVQTYLLSPSSSQTIDVTLESKNMITGTYTGSISLKNNTPDKPDYSIPVSLTVTGVPAIRAINPINFGTLLGYKWKNASGTVEWKPYERNIYIKNIGTDKLVLTTCAVQTETPQQTSAAYRIYNSTLGTWGSYTTLTAAQGTLYPGDSIRMTITVRPTGTDPATGTINAVNNLLTLNNSSGIASVTIPITATPVYKPILVYSPKRIDLVASDENFTFDTLVSITNNQIDLASKLNFKLDLEFERPVNQSVVKVKSVANKGMVIEPKLYSETKTAVLKSSALKVEGFNRTLEYDTRTTSTSALGYNGAAMLTAATQFVAPADGFSLSHVMSFFIPRDVLNSKLLVEVRTGGTSIGTSEVVHSQFYDHNISVADNDGSFLLIKLDKSIYMYPNEVFYVTVRFPMDCTYPLGVVSNTNYVSNRYFYYDKDSDTWIDLNSSSSLKKYAIMMKALEEKAENKSWLTLTSTQLDTIDANFSTKKASLHFNSRWAVPGMNNAKMIIYNNDSINPVGVANLSLYLNQAPKFNCGNELNLSVDENVSLTYTVKINDPEGNSLTTVIDPMNGLTSTVTENSVTFTYLPTFNDAGVHTFYIKTTDSYNAVSNLTVNITVYQVNRIPVAQPIADQILYMGSDNLVMTLASIFSDPDLDALKYTVTTSTPSIIDVAIGTSSCVLFQKTAGETNVTLTATDPSNATVSQSFKVNVVANNAPVLASAIGDQLMKVNDGVKSVSLANIFTDADSDPLTYTITNSNQSASNVVVNGNHIEITPLAIGNSIVSLTANDGRGGSVVCNFIVMVQSSVGIGDNESLGVIQMYPNPAIDYVNFAFNLSKVSEVSIVVTDIIGTLIKTINNPIISDGNSKIRVDLNGLSKGIYMCKISIDNETYTRKLVIK